MLQTQAVSPELLELLKKIASFSEFMEFRLVGETALALQEGHRMSIDLDFFGDRQIDPIIFTNVLKTIGEIKIVQQSKHILIYTINNIKVDFVYYPYKWVAPPLIYSNFTLASRPDIAAMKLNAISGRGSKKDFIDLYFLLNHFSLREMLGFFKEKYPEGSEFLVIKSLFYFQDADEEAEPKMLKEFDWGIIKKTIFIEANKLV
jgi:hypothetical protein